MPPSPPAQPIRSSPRRTVLVAFAGLALGGLMWWYVGDIPPESATEEGPDPSVISKRDRSRGHRHGGTRRPVFRRGNHVGEAVPEISGQVIDPEGTGVGGGSIVLFCLDEEPSGHVWGGSPLAVDKDGYFSGESCEGRVCALLQHESKIQLDEWVFESGDNSLELVVRDRVRLHGVVQTSQGEPVAGAKVRVRSVDDGDFSATPMFTTGNDKTSVTTTADGRFTFFRVERPPCDPCGEASLRCSPDIHERTVNDSDIRLIGSARGFQTTSNVVENDIRLFQSDVTLVLSKPLAPIAGQIVGSDNVPHSRAEVQAISDERPYEVHRMKVDGQGRFEFDAIGDGTYSLTALGFGRRLAVKGAVEAGDELAIISDLDGHGLDVEVRVLGIDAHPVSGLKISGGPFEGERTNKEGIVVLESIPAGSYFVWLHTSPRRQKRTLDVPKPNAKGAMHAVTWSLSPSP